MPTEEELSVGQRLAFEQKLLASQQAREAEILKNTGFERCTFLPDDRECEMCDHDHLQLYYRRTCHDSDEGQYYCLYCIAEEKAAQEQEGRTVDFQVEVEVLQKQLAEAKALAEEERRFKCAAEASVARLTRLLDETLDARDGYRGRCRAATQRIIESIGAHGPENIEEAVDRLLGRIKKQSTSPWKLPGELVQPCGPDDGVPFEPWVRVSDLVVYGISFQEKKS